VCSDCQTSSRARSSVMTFPLCQWRSGNAAMYRILRVMPKPTRLCLSCCACKACLCTRFSVSEFGVSCSLLLLLSRVAQSVYCLTMDWTAGVRSPTGAEDFSSNFCIQTGSGAHPASYTVGTGGSFPGGKARPGRDADHSPPSSAEVKKE
jgi:hypothetical protein